MVNENSNLIIHISGCRNKSIFNFLSQYATKRDSLFEKRAEFGDVQGIGNVVHRGKCTQKSRCAYLTLRIKNTLFLKVNQNLRKYSLKKS